MKNISVVNLLNNYISKRINLFLTFIFTTIILSSCGTASKISVSGYDDSDFMNKNVALITPISSDIKFENPEGLSIIRGVSSISLPEQILMEFRNDYPKYISGYINTSINFFHYYNQPFAAMYPLDLQKDFSENINWNKLETIIQNSKVNYFLIVSNVVITNKYTSKADTDKVGEEIIQYSYILIDPAKKKILTKGEFKNSVNIPRTVSSTIQNNCAEFVKKLPFPLQEKNK